MPFLALDVVLSFLLDLIHGLGRDDPDMPIEVVLLRQRLRPSRGEQAALTATLPSLPRA